MAEQSAVNRWVVGSSPTSGANHQVVGGYLFTVRAKNWHGARDLSRRNAGPADPRWEIAMPFCQPTFLRTKVRAPIAVSGETVNTYVGGQRRHEEAGRQKGANVQ